MQGLPKPPQGVAGVFCEGLPTPGGSGAPGDKGGSGPSQEPYLRSRDDQRIGHAKLGGATHPPGSWGWSAQADQPRPGAGS